MGEEDLFRNVMDTKGSSRIMEANGSRNSNFIVQIYSTIENDDFVFSMFFV